MRKRRNSPLPAAQRAYGARVRGAAAARTALYWEFSQGYAIELQPARRAAADTSFTVHCHAGKRGLVDGVAVHQYLNEKKDDAETKLCCRRTCHVMAAVPAVGMPRELYPGL
jgi:hypothetical protein